MTWTSLNALLLNQTGDYSPLPVAAAGGEINLRIPAFPAGESGTYRVGIYSGTPENPGFIADQTVILAPYQRHLRFAIPANTPGLLVGFQLLTHEDLPGASYELVPEWQPVNALGQFPGGCQLPLALSLEQVTGLVSGNIAANYATYEELSGLVTGLELAVSLLRQALEEQLAAIELTPGPKGDKGDKGDTGDQGIPGQAPPLRLADWRYTGPASWPRYQADLLSMVSENQARPLVDSLSTPAGIYPTGGAYYGGVLLPDGRVFCVPYNGTTARIYDPATNTLSTPAGSYAGGAAFADGCLLKDGRVFLFTYNSTTARIYDPVTNTLSTPAGTYPGGAAFHTGVLLPDGRVFCVPLSSTTGRIYDPVTDTLSTPAGTYPGGAAFTCGVLLPDGRVFLVPYTSTTARIYDPVTNTLSTPAGTYPGGAAFGGGVLLPDGRVFCVPLNSTTARIYDPVTNTLSIPAGTYPGLAAFNSGVTLPDGRVFCVPGNSSTSRIYTSREAGELNMWNVLFSAYYNKY